jgi:hypothetical protein
MALGAVFRGLHIEGFLSVVALSTEIPFGELAHVHLVRTLRHLEYLVMAAGALDALVFDMGLMAENYRACVLGRELDVSATDLLCDSRVRQDETYNQKHDHH